MNYEVGNATAIYIDGSRVISSSIINISYPVGSVARIGNSISGTSIYSMNGTIDEVRIWNKSFAPDETVVMKQII